MNKDAFEWDEDKAAANWRAHGVAFHQAVKAFRDPFGVEWIDEREHYGEERINLLGLCEGVILHVTYTERGEHIRLISARRAEYLQRKFDLTARLSKCCATAPGGRSQTHPCVR